MVFEIHIHPHKCCLGGALLDPSIICGEQSQSLAVTVLVSHLSLFLALSLPLFLSLSLSLSLSFSLFPNVHLCCVFSHSVVISPLIQAILARSCPNVHLILDYLLEAVTVFPTVVPVM